MALCKKCGNTLASDGGCEVCWLRCARENAEAFNRSMKTFFAELKRRHAIAWEEDYINWANTVHAFTGVYPSFEVYEGMRIAEEYRQEEERRSGGR